MGLDRLVEEILARSAREADEVKSATDAQVAAIGKDRDERIRKIEDDGRRATDVEVARIRTQRVASAKLAARKSAYESRERQTKARLEEVRGILEKFAESDDYTAVVKRMVQTASDRLGKPIRIRGRSDDASLLKTAAGKSYDPEPLPILGGIVAETPDGSRRLNLSLDELLRLNEDQVRALLPP